MSPWVRQVFLNWMPRILMMRRTPYSTPEYDDTYIDSGYTNEIDSRYVYVNKFYYFYIKNVFNTL